jgi:hypothetical protein
VLPLQLPDEKGKQGQALPYKVKMAVTLTGTYALFCIPQRLQLDLAKAREACPDLMKCSCYGVEDAARMSPTSSKLFFTSVVSPDASDLMKQLQHMCGGWINRTFNKTFR